MAPGSPQTRRIRPLSALRSFLSTEASGGQILIAVAILALIVANSPLADLYFSTLKIHVGGMSVLHWINDALMVLFFLLVGLEIKRELQDGHLSTWPRRILPGVAAAAGMLFPALIYLAINYETPETLRGWAIPTATDIAFALGILSLVRDRVPVSLKIFLTALAILDDLGAVAIIAGFYTQQLALGWLAGALAVLAVLIALNRFGVEKLTPYLVLGAVLWFFVLKSGAHPTLAGVALALCIPLRASPGAPEDARSPLHRLEHAIQPWVAFLVVPLFGFANAGVSLVGLSWSALLEPVTLGIMLGLFIGKQIGVFSTIWLAVKMGFVDRPEDATYPQIYGVCLLCGIGFTMSLFVGLLAFPTSEHLHDVVKVGVLSGSLLSTIVGLTVLRFSKGEPRFEQRRQRTASASPSD